MRKVRNSLYTPPTLEPAGAVRSLSVDRRGRHGIDTCDRGQPVDRHRTGAYFQWVTLPVTLIAVVRDMASASAPAPAKLYMSSCERHTPKVREKPQLGSMAIETAASPLACISWALTALVNDENSDCDASSWLTISCVVETTYGIRP